MVLLAMAPHAGHVNATLGLARALAERGVPVVYTGEPAVADLVAPHGFAFRPLPLTMDQRGHPPWQRRMRAGAGLRAHAYAVTDAAARLVGDLAPGLVVFDPFVLVYYPVFAALGVPAAALSTKPLLRHDRWTPPYTSALLPRADRLGPLQVSAAWAAQHARYRGYRIGATARRLCSGRSPRLLMDHLSEVTGVAWRDTWITRPVSFDARFAGVPELVLTVAEFELAHAPPPADVIYLGACLDLQRREPPLEPGLAPAGARIAYCSLGTSPHGLDRTDVRLLDTVARAFAGRDGWHLVLATGRADLAARWDGCAPNVVARARLPQVGVLRRATVMINHGGHNSVKECIGLGVPMVVYPRRADQPGVSARVVKHRLGVRGDRRRVTPDAVFTAAAEVAADPAVRAGLAAMRRSFAGYDQAGTAVNAVLRLAAADHDRANPG